MFVLASCLLLLLPTSCSQDMHGMPVRPKVFRNADELRMYLKALNEYFAIVGRPRYVRFL
ncbi:hypothetical protein CAPTEDRAFT_122119 [Capitella teleta]|uniref:Neuropeptide F n=1 Tax=Capitella teleta TaxID=283909 RepID=R7TJJ4_CAPTE|nr:hypothetical protein CAPTEDRAFT_122119 [Capitella teleta]|eukprot:ELT93672.1 hypothetical protein CAPTEDRAFT_122119 [Capitella teleta]